MDLDEYLWRSRTSQRQFARDTGINSVTICHIKNFLSIPNLKTALIIHRASEGKISIMELLHPDLREEFAIIEKKSG